LVLISSALVSGGYALLKGETRKEETRTQKRKIDEMRRGGSCVLAAGIV
jgi:hypothetical protein